MNKKTKIILGITLALLLGLFFIVGNAQKPPINSECTAGWNLIWEFKNHKYCSEYSPWGNYELYSCTVLKWSNYNQEYYKTIIHESTCLYTSSITLKKNFLPLVTK